MDTNRDGNVSEVEYRTFMEQAFTKLDKTGDGKLARPETATVLTDAEFAMLDKNKRGYVTRDEFMSHVMDDFRKQDRDGNSMLTR